MSDVCINPSIPFLSESEWPLKVSFHGCDRWIYGAIKSSIYRKGCIVRLTLLNFRGVKLLLLLKI
ncbi:hypothetical protein H5410_001618 [Solanum commersonii]|uniref:Uncharacterized protein n=1 Tax=Solanum commersonii TaxID=4109 RepID=A0A9J6AZ96_SOLCO|nr:hypothetical protein H5410_001618 [Solanum commersonii]